MDWLFGLFNQIGGAVSNAVLYLNSIVAWLLAAVTFLANALEVVTTWIAKVLTALTNFLRNLWDYFIKNIVGRILAWLQQAQRWLESHLKPVIDFLKKARAWWDRYYRLHILPIINMIQRIRRFLLILRLLHIHIADALDKWLQKYEAALNKVFLTVHGTLNQLIGWATLASSPIGLGRMVLVSVTGRRTVAAITRAVTGLPIGHFFPSTSSTAFAFERQPQSLKDYQSEVTNPPASQIMAPLLSLFATESFDDQVGATDQDIDAVEATPWGGEYMSQLLASEHAYAGLVYDGLSLRQALEAKAGNVYNAGAAGAGVCLKSLTTYD